MTGIAAIRIQRKQGIGSQFRLRADAPSSTATHAIRNRNPIDPSPRPSMTGCSRRRSTLSQQRPRWWRSW